MWVLLAVVALAYLSGSVPTGVWLARRQGVDPRDIGSGNIGATNVARAAGTATGALTLVGDTLKGLGPILLATYLGIGEGGCALVALAAFTGHIFPCFLGFQGGKGVAIALGVLLGLAPLAMAIVVPIFLLTVAVSRYVSLGSILTAAMTPIVLAALAYPATTIVVAAVMGTGIAYRHRDNIRRLRFGTEARLGGRRSTFPDSGYA
ncbi:MAG: acyl-phosphate glycerol 3-phosphate acyltransferase [Polyangiaceae bacterium UTPRO1]|jgi:glycerol-3-phosphate acyltransferase PlsY|nr:glycerol-3-phosphate 1-O-acyltransferase PlsY [Myxococcales bacterium]OQY67723.1 MAG: acyl-phosphate glycerol 3-phosphate acyltransferase [Polyangiaceae bacterium UTPRO1]